MNDPARPFSALVSLARPRGAPFVMLLPWVGYGFAHWDRALTLQNPSAIAWITVAWGALHAGTMWLNAALDRDEGEVLFGTPARVPPSTAAWGRAALALAILLSIPAGPVPAACTAGCALLAVSYSHRRTAWKGHWLLGPAVNVVGYALLSPLAGWWVVGVTVNPRTLAVLALFVPWVLGCYFAAQVFQQDEDRRRGYRTLVARRGSRATAMAARACLGAAAIGFFALTVAGWFPRACLVGIPLFVRADRWLARPPTPEWGEVAFGRLLWFAWTLLGALTFEYARTSWLDEPVAGLATAAGHPDDRPRLSPRDLQVWERSHR